MPHCHICHRVARRVPRVKPLVNCVTLGGAWRNTSPSLSLSSSLSLHHYLPQYVAVNPNLSITLTGKGPGSSNGGQGQRSVRHGANFCGRTRDLMCVYYEAFNALNCEITTTTTAGGEITTVTTTIMATKRPLINNKLNTQ